MTGEASQQQRRQDDTRRKIIAGALALEPAEANADFAAELAIGTSPDRRTAPLFDFLRDRTPD